MSAGSQLAIGAAGLLVAESTGATNVTPIGATDDGPDFPELPSGGGGVSGDAIASIASAFAETARAGSGAVESGGGGVDAGSLGESFARAFEAGVEAGAGAAGDAKDAGADAAGAGQNAVTNRIVDSLTAGVGDRVGDELGDASVGDGDLRDTILTKNDTFLNLNLGERTEDTSYNFGYEAGGVLPNVADGAYDAGSKPFTDLRDRIVTEGPGSVPQYLGGESEYQYGAVTDRVIGGVSSLSEVDAPSVPSVGESGDSDGFDWRQAVVGTATGENIRDTDDGESGAVSTTIGDSYRASNVAGGDASAADDGVDTTESTAEEDEERRLTTGGVL